MHCVTYGLSASNAVSGNKFFRIQCTLKGQPRSRRFDVLRQCVARAREERVGENEEIERQSAGDEAAEGCEAADESNVALFMCRT